MFGMKHGGGKFGGMSAVVMTMSCFLMCSAFDTTMSTPPNALITCPKACFSVSVWRPWWMP